MFSINNARLLICTHLFRENCKYFETLSFSIMLDCKSSVIGWLGVTGTQRFLCLLYSLILNMEYIICEYFFCISVLAGILLRFPSQKRTVLVRKPYVFGTENVRFWDGNRRRETIGKRF